MSLPTVAVLVALVAVPSLASAQEGVLVRPALRPPPPCNGVAGLYDGGRTVHVGKDGRTVRILVSPRLPMVYGQCAGPRLAVAFGGGGATEGTFDGRAIVWDDGTVWRKR
jgi:hypothetical protein